MKRNRTALKKLLRPLWWRVALLTALAMLQSVGLVGFSLTTKYVIDSAVNKDGSLWTWAMVLGGVVLLILTTNLLQAWYSGSTGDKSMARMRHALLSAAAHSEDARLESYHSGELLSRGMEDVNTICDGFVNTIPTMLGQSIRLVCTFLAVAILSPSLAPILLLAGILVVGASALIRPVMKRKHQQVRKTEEQVMASMQENLQQLELIKSLQTEERILDRFALRLRISLAAKASRRRYTVASGALMAGISQIGTAALLLWGAVQIWLDKLSYGSLTAMLQLISLFRTPVVGLSGTMTKLTAMEVAAGRLLDLLETQQPQEDAPVQDISVQAVVFEHVTFRYPSDETPVVRDFSISFPLENWACLTGISGKGKTTLFKLMLGLYTPQEGRVYLKTDKGEIPCGKQTRHLFAYVPQDYALFSGTVQENLQLVAPDATQEECMRALQIAQAGFVSDLSHREQTQVRENNSGLSKGQLQRLAIARAVLMERPIFLLDECTSALDASTESAVLQNLQRLGKQAILVTHRPDAVAELGKVTFVAMEQS